MGKEFTIHNLNAGNLNMKLLLMIIGVLLISTGFFVILCNYVYLMKNYLNKKHNVKKFHSLIPLLGALLVMGGSFILSVKFKIYFLLIFIFDPGTAVLLLSIPRLIKEMQASKK